MAPSLTPCRNPKLHVKTADDKLVSQGFLVNPKGGLGLDRIRPYHRRDLKKDYHKSSFKGVASGLQVFKEGTACKGDLYIRIAGQHLFGWPHVISVSRSKRKSKSRMKPKMESARDIFQAARKLC